MTPRYDYEASKRKLSERLRQMNESTYSPTPEVRRLRELAEHLDKTADTLSELRWAELEAAVDANPLPGWEPSGWPVYPDENRAGRFKGTVVRLREIAAIAREQAEALPNPRQDPVLPYGATVLLHLMYECDRPVPTMYDGGNAVAEFREVCTAAGIYKSPERLRTALSAAWREFDASSPPPGFEYILTVKD